MKALYTIKDIFVILFPAVNPACSVAINWFGLEPVQDDFHYDFTGMADVTDGSVVLVELLIGLFSSGSSGRAVDCSF